MILSLRSRASRFFVPAFVLHSLCNVALGSPPIEYVKEEHPPKLEGVLARIQKKWTAQERALAVATARQYSAAKLVGGNITVVLEPRYGRLSESVDFTALSDLGVRITARSRHLIEVSAPIATLERLSQVKGVQFVRLPIRPRKFPVVSEGVERIKARIFSNSGFTGLGIKVGVIDLGFVGVPSLQRQGELPSNLNGRDFTGQGTFTNDVHGTACAEIVHDVAPDADLFLYKVSNVLSLENAKDAAIQEGLDIVSVSMGWRGTGFGDGTGRACNIVNDAFQNDVLWVNAAGNHAQSQVSALLSDQDGNGYHDFDGRGEVVNLKDRHTGNTFLDSGEKIEAWLTWNEWPLTSHDYDLLLVKVDTDGKNEIVERGNTRQRQSPPFERLIYKIPEAGKYGLMIWRAPDAKVTRLKLTSDNHDLEGPVSTIGSLSIPADARGSLTVGALHHREWETGPIADYSSQGPTIDGRIKPDLVAPAGVLTVSYGADGYFGTSAATPHVAGAAALLKSSDPIHYNAQNLYDALLRSTVDMGDPGPDNVYGNGRLDLSQLPTEGRPVMELSRNVLDFGAVLLRSSQTLDLGIVNTGRSSLVITEILLPSGEFGLSRSSFPVAPGRREQISVTFTPRSEGDRSGDMTILSNSPQTNVVLRARGVRQPVVPVPVILINSSRRNFGEVEVGSTKSIPVTVTNSGDASLTITEITSSNEQVSVSPRQLTIPAMQNGYFTLYFQPNTAQDFSGRVTIYSDDSKTPVVEFAVIGKGLRSQTMSFALSLVVDAPKNQDVYTLPSNGIVTVEIHGRQVKDAIGFRALFDSDTPSFTYEDFDIGDAIPNGHSPGPYYPSDPFSVEVMAASFGGTIAESSAKLGTVRFSVSDTLQSGTMRLQYARIRRSGEFEVFADPIVLRFSKQGGLPADFDGDGTVGFGDFLLFAGRFGSASGQAEYDARYDLDGNGAIGFGDFLLFANAFGQKAS